MCARAFGLDIDLQLLHFRGEVGRLSIIDSDLNLLSLNTHGYLFCALLFQRIHFPLS